MAKAKATKAEKERRRQQSAKDKKRPKVRIAGMPKPVNAKPAKKGSGGSAGSSYANLVLDPCNASFAQSGMPGSTGGQCVRLPFRQIVTVPTATTNITGGSGSGLVVGNTLIGVLTPHAMVPGVGPTAISIYSNSSESAGFGVPAINGPYSVNVDPLGLSALTSYVGEMRPVAACIRITCLSPDTSNSGCFVGYEGAARQFLGHAGTADDTQAFYPAVSAQQLMFNGKTTSQTFKTYEVKMNLPNADLEFQQFRQVTGSQSSATGVYRSGDAGDADWSNVPCAIAGVTSATPGSQYLFDGAIVYEWVPKVSIGIIAPPKQAGPSTAFAKAAKIVQNVANSWGGMLITTAIDSATGGSATNAMALVRRGYAAYNASRGLTGA